MLDEWVARIYGLNQWDREVIRDTLSVGLSFEVLKEKPDRHPEMSEVETFVRRVHKELEPFLKPGSMAVHVEHVDSGSPWVLLVIEPGPRTPSTPRQSSALSDMFRRADALGASQIVLSDPASGSLVIAILRQYRFWTPTRARLLALEILEEHLDVLVG